MKKKEKTIRDEVVNKSLAVLLIFALLTQSLATIGILQLGLDIHFLIHAIIIVFFSLLIIFRHKLNLNLKVYSIAIVILLTLFWGMWEYGYFAASKNYIILLLIFITLVLPGRQALFFLVVSIFIFFFFGFLYTRGYLNYDFKVETYIRDKFFWILEGVSILLAGLTILYVGYILSTTLEKNYNALKKRNREIRESEENYKALVQNIPSVVYRCLMDEHWTMKMISDKIYDLTGYQPTDFIDNKVMSYSDIIHPEDAKYVEETVKAAVERRETFNLNYRVLNHKGKVIWVDEKGTPFYDSDGNIKWLDGFINDVSETKATELALIENEKKFRTLFLSLGDAAFVMKRNMFIDCNGMATEMFGLKREEIMNSYPWILSPEFQGNGVTSIDAASQKMQYVLDGENQIFEWIHKKSNGELFDVEVSLTLVDAEEEIFLALVRDITERKRAEKQLKENKLKFEAIFNKTYSFIGLLDNKGILLEANDTSLKFINKKAEEVVGKVFWDTPWWNHSEEEMRHLKKAVKSAMKGELVKFETTHIDFEGNKHHINFVLKPNLDDDGNVAYLIPEGRIVTEQKKLEEELRNSEEQNKMIIKNVPVVLWKTDEHGKTSFISDNVERIYGYTPDEIYNNGKKYWLDRIHPEDLPHVLTRFNEFFANNRQFNIEYRIKTKEGKWIWLHDFADTVVLEGNIKYAYGVFHEITEKKKMEIALVESEIKFRNIFNSSTDGIVVSDHEYNILAANKKVLSMVGKDERELKNKKVFDFVSEEGKRIIIKRTENLLAGKEVPADELIVKTAHKQIPIEINSKLITYENERAILTIIHDISEKKLLHKKLFEAQVESEEHERERYAKELHDGLGPLLSTCKIYFYSLKKQKDTQKRDEQIKRAGELLEEALASIGEISNNLSPHILRNYGLLHALRSFVDKLRNVSNVDFIIDSDVEKRYPEIIEFTLYRIIAELINNSIKYSGTDKISISVLEIDSYVTVNYRDYGIGFNYEEIVKEGRGFGLMNFENRINKIDGKYEYITAPGKGVNVKISLKI